MKHRSLVTAIVLSCMLILTLALPAQAQYAAWYEGIQLRFTDGFKVTAYVVELRATKLVAGSYRASEIAVLINSVDGSIPWVQETVTIPGDPDALSVSDDLGWGGLRTTVMVTDRRTGDRIPMVIDIDQFASTWRYRYDPTMGTGMFVRDADLRGFIEFPGRWRTDFVPTSPFNSTTTAINFSTNWPGY